MRLIAAAIGFSTLLIAPLARAQDETSDKVALTWKFTKGEVLRYEMEHETTTDVNDTQMKQRMEMRTAMEVKDVAADGTATLDMKYERIRMKMEGMVELDYDSDNKDKKEGAEEEGQAGALARMIGGMVGKSITMKMTARGKVLDVSGMDKFAEAMGEGAEMFRQMYGDQQLKHMLQGAFAYLPDRAVGLGDAWDYAFEFDVPMLGKMKTNGESKVRQFQSAGKDAVIRTAIKLTVEAAEGSMVEVKDGKGELDTVWSVADGRMISQTGTVKMTMGAGGQDLEVIVTSKARLAKKGEGKGEEPKGREY